MLSLFLLLLFVLLVSRDRLSNLSRNSCFLGANSASENFIRVQYFINDLVVRALGLEERIIHVRVLSRVNSDIIASALVLD
jgi:hypothetical protein